MTRRSESDWISWYLVVVLVVLACGSARAQSGASRVTIQTRAERTKYRETSSYADVMSFLEWVTEASPRLHLTTFGYSFEGRPLPLVVVGDTPDASAAAYVAIEKDSEAVRRKSGS